MNNFATILKGGVGSGRHKVKLVPHPDNKNPDNFKKFHAHIDGKHVATLSEKGKCPITHVPQKGYKTVMENVRNSDGSKKESHQRTKANAADWIAANHVPAA